MKKDDLLVIILIGLFLMVIFAIDISIPLGFNGGIPYVVLMFMCWWFPNGKSALYLAIFGSILTGLGYFISPASDIPTWVPIINRIMSIFAICITGFLLNRGKNSRNQLKIISENIEERLEKIILTSMDAVVSMDSQKRIILFNKGAEKIFGYKQSDVLGQKLTILIPEDVLMLNSNLPANHRLWQLIIVHTPISHDGQLGVTKVNRSEIFGIVA